MSEYLMKTLIFKNKKSCESLSINKIWQFFFKTLLRLTFISEPFIFHEIFDVKKCKFFQLLSPRNHVKYSIKNISWPCGSRDESRTSVTNRYLFCDAGTGLNFWTLRSYNIE